MEKVLYSQLFSLFQNENILTINLLLQYDRYIVNIIVFIFIQSCKFLL